jgi:hypothetical protein
MTAILYTARSSSSSPVAARELEMLEQLRAAGFEPKARRGRIDCWTATMPEEGVAIFAATLEGLLQRATVALLALGLQL